MGSIKQINIKNCPYYLFKDMINIKKHLIQTLLGIDKISFKSIDAVNYNIGYITMKIPDHVNIDSGNPLYLIFNNEDGYMEEKMEINT